MVEIVDFVFAELFAGEFVFLSEFVEDCLEGGFFVFAVQVVKNVEKVVGSVLFLHVVKYYLLQVPKVHIFGFRFLFLFAYLFSSFGGFLFLLSFGLLAFFYLRR